MLVQSLSSPPLNLLAEIFPKKQIDVAYLNNLGIEITFDGMLGAFMWLVIYPIFCYRFFINLVIGTPLCYHHGVSYT